MSGYYSATRNQLRNKYGRMKSPVPVDSASDSDGRRSPSPVTELIPTTTSRVVLTISLRRPPRFHVPITNKSGRKMPVNDGKRQIKKRQATSWDFVDYDLEGNRECEEINAGPLSVWAEQETFKVREHHAIFVSLANICNPQMPQYLTYRFTMYLTDNQYSLLTRLLQRLRIYSVSIRPELRIAGFNGARGQDLNIISQRSENTQRKYLKSYNMPELPGVPSINSPQPGNMAKLAAKLSELLKDQRFSMRWLIEGLVSHGIILPFEVQLLLEALEAYCPSNPSGRLDSYEAEAQRKFQERILTAMFNEERVKDINAYVKSKYPQKRGSAFAINNNLAEKAEVVKSTNFVQDPPHIVRIRRVYVTPSRILMFPPEPETGNSVLRAFKNADCFLRVTMTDEDDRLQVGVEFDLSARCLILFQ